MKDSKIVSLQILRAIAFLMIFFFHTNIGKYGPFAVSVFFVLSGFVMIYSKKDKMATITIKNSFMFSINRIKKLYGLHIIAMLTCLLLMLFIDMLQGNYINPINILIKIGANVLLIQSLIPSDVIYLSLNGVAWYLSASLFIYMFYPLISNYLREKETKKVIYSMVGSFLIQILSLLVILLANVHLSFSNDFAKWFTYIFPLYRLGDFFIGCCLGYLYINNKIKISKIKSTVLEFVCIIFIVLINCIYDNAKIYLFDDRFKFTIINLPIALTLVILFACNKGSITKLLSKSKILLKIGNLSGYLFLIHQVVIRFMTTILTIFDKIHLNAYILALIELLLSYLLACLYSNVQKKIEKSKLEGRC